MPRPTPSHTHRNAHADIAPTHAPRGVAPTSAEHAVLKAASFADGEAMRSPQTTADERRSIRRAYKSFERSAFGGMGVHAQRRTGIVELKDALGDAEIPSVTDTLIALATTVLGAATGQLGTALAARIGASLAGTGAQAVTQSAIKAASGEAGGALKAAVSKGVGANPTYAVQSFIEGQVAGMETIADTAADSFPLEDEWSEGFLGVEGGAEKATAVAKAAAETAREADGVQFAASLAGWANTVHEGVGFLTTLFEGEQGVLDLVVSGTGSALTVVSASVDGIPERAWKELVVKQVPLAAVMGDAAGMVVKVRHERMRRVVIRSEPGKRTAPVFKETAETAQFLGWLGRDTGWTEGDWDANFVVAQRLMNEVVETTTFADVAAAGAKGGAR